VDLKLGAIDETLQRAERGSDHFGGKLSSPAKSKPMHFSPRYATIIDRRPHRTAIPVYDKEQ
jgi:hypothetical protein